MNPMILENIFVEMTFPTQFTLSLLIVFIAIEAGFLCGAAVLKRKKHEKETPIGSLVGAMLGLLAFMMAFTFGMSSSYFETRRALILKESNAIGTAYLRSDFIPEPGRTEVRRLLREYVDVRVEGVKAGNFSAAVEHSEKILDQLWSKAAALNEVKPVTVLSGLFVQALNDVIDIHSERLVNGAHRHIPGVIWLTLYFVMFFAMFAVGFQFGLDGARSFIGMVILALMFSAVMVLIADLDSPSKGMIKTSQWSLIELQGKLSAETKLDLAKQA